MFCTRCGNEIAEGKQFCPNCGEPVANSESRTESEQISAIPVMQVQEVKEKHAKWPIVVAVFVSLIVVAGLGVFGYDLVKTQAFRENIVTYEQAQTHYEGLGKYEEDYNEILEEADAASARFQFWKYEELIDEMNAMEKQIKQMNEQVAEYREQYEEVVSQIETDGHYYMGDYQEEYQSVKSELEAALKEFDDKACKTEAQSFTELRDRIVTKNQEREQEIAADTQNICSSFTDITYIHLKDI